MSQRYTSPIALERMADGKCPECGTAPEDHSNDQRFWARDFSQCLLLQFGVTDRIEQHRADRAGQ